jgi:6-pyruvoyltetrahydropterin/6-carboxytetrahydropterin synthase
MHYLTRRFHFSASHQLCSAQLDDKANKQVYGLCTNLHGHNYRLEITLRGEPDPKTGFFCNVMDLYQLVQREVVDPCEHHFLNDVPLFKGHTTTMENLSQLIWQRIAGEVAQWPGVELYEVLLAETDDNVVRLRKE